MADVASVYIPTESVRVQMCQLAIFAEKEVAMALLYIWDILRMKSSLCPFLDLFVIGREFLIC